MSQVAVPGLPLLAEQSMGSPLFSSQSNTVVDYNLGYANSDEIISHFKMEEKEEMDDSTSTTRGTSSSVINNEEDQEAEDSDYYSITRISNNSNERV